MCSFELELQEWDQRWEQNGKPVPPPHCYKQAIVKCFGGKYAVNVLIETGTFLGDMVASAKDCFKKIYSIELSDLLHSKAQERFAGIDHVTLLQGDSAKVLQELLKTISEPCLFWLDGHYSGGITAKGDKDTPIMEELTAIFAHALDNHIILIDDARCFSGGDYPTIDSLKDFVKNKKPNFVFEVKADIIRIYKENLSLEQISNKFATFDEGLA